MKVQKRTRLVHLHKNIETTLSTLRRKASLKTNLSTDLFYNIEVFLSNKCIASHMCQHDGI